MESMDKSLSRDISRGESTAKRLISESQNKDLYFNMFSLKIIDNGAGISEEGLENLFVNFGSLKEHQQSNHRGTGLGLSICKEIIEKMGGNVKVTSEIGKGTCFTINLISLCTVSGMFRSSQDQSFPQSSSIINISKI